MTSQGVGMLAAAGYVESRAQEAFGGFDLVAPSAMQAQHSSESAEWFTGIEVIEDARYVLGTIDLDPSSCERAQTRVRASRWIGEKENGLVASWGEEGAGLRALVNPPSKKGAPSVWRWWVRLAEMVESGVISSFVYVAFNIMSLESCAVQAKKRKLLMPADCYVCLVRGRTPFDRETAQMGLDGLPALETAENPPNWTAFAMYSRDRGTKIRFRKRFGLRGDVVTRVK